MTQTTQPQETPEATQYDQQVDTLAAAGDVQYAEVIVDGGALVELFAQGVTLGRPVSASLEMTPRQARTLAQALLAAADIADDNRDA
jgi:hypothetical protein